MLSINTKITVPSGVEALDTGQWKENADGPRICANRQFDGPKLGQENEQLS